MTRSMTRCSYKPYTQRIPKGFDSPQVQKKKRRSKGRFFLCFWAFWAVFWMLRIDALKQGCVIKNQGMYDTKYDTPSTKKGPEHKARGYSMEAAARNMKKEAARTPDSFCTTGRYKDAIELL